MPETLTKLLADSGYTPENYAEQFGLPQDWMKNKKIKARVFNNFVAGTGPNTHNSGKPLGAKKEGWSPKSAGRSRRIAARILGSFMRREKQ